MGTNLVEATIATVTAQDTMSAHNIDSNSPRVFPSLCSNSCGYFSSGDSQGLCSVCYKKIQTHKDTSAVQYNHSTTSKSNTEQHTTLSEAQHEVPSAVTTITHDTSNKTEKDGDIPVKKTKKNRCLSCRKKVGLTGFLCRCEGMYCSVHRYSDMHQCNYDYKALGEREISQNNPLVVAQKVVRI